MFNTAEPGPLVARYTLAINCDNLCLLWELTPLVASLTKQESSLIQVNP